MDHTSTLTAPGISDTDLRIEAAPNGRAIPKIISPAIANFPLSDWAQAHRDAIDAELDITGALLFRGFDIPEVADFERIVAAMSREVMSYTERSSPRTLVGQKAYSSTEHPAHQTIFPHNEHSYATRLPRKLFFHCRQPAAAGGNTPIGNVRRLLHTLPADLLDEFERRGWMYVRNFNDGFGLTWQTVFQTSNRDEVEQYCRRMRIEYEWKDDDRLRTRQTRPAVAVHPRTGERTWFNHATFFHVTSLESDLCEALRASFADEDLPNHTYFGDGSPIADETAAILREAYAREMVTFDWRSGDLLVIDNMLTAHARESFTGPRQVLVAMSDPHTRTDLGGE